MKKLLTITALILVVALSLASCDSVQQATADMLGSVANNLGATTAAGSSDLGSDEITVDIGEVCQTHFFDFTVKKVYRVEDHDYDLADGMQLIAVDIKVKNVFKSDIPMFNGDFSIYSEYEAGDVFYDPVLEAGLKNQLPDEYDLKPKQEIEGTLYYEISEDFDEMVLTTYDNYENGDVGNYFYVDLAF